MRAYVLPGYGGMSVPAWRLKSERFADESFYAFDTEDGGLRAYLEKVTPREFAWRGLHLGPNMRQRARRRRRCCPHMGQRARRAKAVFANTIVEAIRVTWTANADAKIAGVLPAISKAQWCG